MKKRMNFRCVKSFLISDWHSMLKFVVVGGIATLLDFIIYMVVSQKLDITFSKAISMMFSSIVTYVVNKTWTFRNSSKTGGIILLKFYIAFILNMGTNLTVNYFIFCFSHNKILSFLFATGCATIVHFMLEKYFVFTKKN